MMTFCEILVLHVQVCLIHLCTLNWNAEQATFV